MKTIKIFIKKAVKAYFKNMYEIYKPCYEAGINPFH